jgi:hypothetical protein
VFNLYNQKDNNGYFLKGDYIFKNDHKYNSQSVDKAINKITSYKNALLSENNKVYISIIPDKNYYLESELKLSYDYDRLFTTVKENIDFAEYIDISNLLTLDSFYATDTHWRQEKIEIVAEEILKSMNPDFKSVPFETVTTEKFFDGVFARQTSFKTNGDEMKYLINDLLNDAVLTDKTTDEVLPIYNLEKIESSEPYDMFMSGAKMGLITLERKEKTTGKELIVFRDSFGSSIGPLLLQGYDKITFIDTRQILPVVIKQNNLVEFSNQDVLFLYSSTVLNDSSEMK